MDMHMIMDMDMDMDLHFTLYFTLHCIFKACPVGLARRTRIHPSLC
jgi:hypothetical protein